MSQSCPLEGVLLISGLNPWNTSREAVVVKMQCYWLMGFSSTTWTYECRRPQRERITAAHSRCVTCDNTTDWYITGEKSARSLGWLSYSNGVHSVHTHTHTHKGSAWIITQHICINTQIHPAEQTPLCVHLQVQKMHSDFTEFQHGCITPDVLFSALSFRFKQRNPRSEIIKWISYNPWS